MATNKAVKLVLGGILALCGTYILVFWFLI
jgi:hypothetical protein